MRKIKENVNPSRNNDETQKSALHSKSLVYSFNAMQCIVRGRTSNNNNKKQPLMQLNEMWLQILKYQCTCHTGKKGKSQFQQFPRGCAKENTKERYNSTTKNYHQGFVNYKTKAPSKVFFPANFQCDVQRKNSFILYLFNFIQNSE